MDFAAAKALVRERLGMRIDGPAEDSLRGGLDRRMRITGEAYLGAYLERLAKDPDELAALASLLTINETYFYREPLHLRWLTDRLGPRLLAARPDVAPIRILSVGCSSGEEPFSIAMALCERWGRAALDWFSINACDVDPEALERARKGCFRPHSFRALSPALIERWFRRGPDETLCLADEIRGRVHFSHLNLLDWPYPGGLRGQDLIFYRNLSIYFDADTRILVQRRLGELLAPRGCLIVGTAEVLANDLGLLTRCEEDGVWYFARAGTEPATAPTAARTRVTPPAPTARRGARVSGAATRPDSRSSAARRSAISPHDGALERALELVREGRLERALQELLPLAESGSDPVGARPLVLLAWLQLEQGQAQAAGAAAERALGDDPWSAPALTLLGRLARLAGDPDAAIAHARRAVYAQTAFWPAHLLLAETYRDLGNRTLARRAYRSVLQQLDDESAAMEQAGPLPPPLPISDLRALCQFHLARLDAAA